MQNNQAIVAEVRPNSRLFGLDALRGLAALAVVLYHYTGRYDRLYGHVGGLPFALEIGQVGVQVFFMISGFVILMTLQRFTPGVQGVVAFAYSRFGRLYPVYWAAAILTFLVVYFFGLPGREVSGGALLANMTMLPRFFFQPMVDGVYWTLEKEILFYIWMGLMLWLGLVQRAREVFLLWAAVSLLYHVHGIFLYSECGYLFKVVKEILLLDWIPFFGLGIIAFLWVQGSGVRVLDLLTILICLSAIALSHPLQDLIIVIVAWCVILWLTSSGRCWVPPRTLIWLGTISYSFYLVHQNIGYVLLRAFQSMSGSGPLMSIMITTILTLGLASLLTVLVEIPSQRWLKGVTRRRVSVSLT